MGQKSTGAGRGMVWLVVRQGVAAQALVVLVGILEELKKEQRQQ